VEGVEGSRDCFGRSGGSYRQGGVKNAGVVRRRLWTRNDQMLEETRSFARWVVLHLVAVPLRECVPRVLHGYA